MSESTETKPTEFSLPPVVPVPPTGNLPDIIERNAAEVPDRAVYSRFVDGEWIDVTAGEFRQEVVRLAKGLAAAGIQPGDRVALLSRTRYEWTLFDFAIWYAGAVVVPIYPTASQQQLEWQLADSASIAIVVESAAHEAQVREAMDRLPSVRHAWTIDAGCVADLGAAARSVSDDEIAARRTSLGADSLATIIYASGTTGEPKGCMLTHGNFIFAVGTDVEILPELFGPESSTLLFLPLAHVFPRIVEIGCAMARVRLGHSPSISSLQDDLQTFQPTFLLVVPRVLENIFNNASQLAFAEGRGGVFNLAASTAIAYSRALDRGRRAPLVRGRHAMFDRLVYSNIRAALGGKVQYAVSGAAPLGERLAHFFRGCGVTIVEGYGLTETTAATSVNRIGANRIGTVGQPLPGTEVRIGDDDEVLIRGPHVFSGYFGHPQLTGEAFDEQGWLRTGDLGRLDAAGFLTLIGRKKEIIVTAGGKNVTPAPLEDMIRSHPLISHCLVVGEGQPYVAALITLDRDAVRQWAVDKGKPTRVRDLLADPDLLAEIQTAVDAANETVSQAESIRKFRLLPVDWTEASGHITPTLKVRRSVVMRDFAADIDRLYP